jgi:hypothetical protein
MHPTHRHTIRDTDTYTDTEIHTYTHVDGHTTHSETRMHRRAPHSKSI